MAAARVARSVCLNTEKDSGTALVCARFYVGRCVWLGDLKVCALTPDGPRQQNSESLDLTPTPRRMRLYRPVGVAELELIRQAEFKGFPPRLAHQPVFYPVLELDYAAQIARDWNTKDAASGYAGFVTSFELSDGVGERYPVRVVGSTAHRELWVPAEELDQFNDGLESGIEVVAHFVGAGFEGAIDPDTHLPEADVPSPSRERGCLDDNGNEYVMRSDLGLEAALHLVAEYEARGHKQTYWARAQHRRGGEV